MSEATLRPLALPVRLLAYAVVASAIVFELSVVWLMLHPNVPDDFRAYYIDQTTTCLNQPVSGAYELGATISFVSEGREAAMPLRVCGWEGPAGDGTHAVGQTSRLRFALPTDTPGPLTLTLQLVAVVRAGYPSQRIVVEADGTELGIITALAGVPLTVDLSIPAETVAAQPEALEIFLHYPDAIRMAPSDRNTRLRSIKLLSARLAPA